MAIMTLVFDQPMVVPVDDAGLTITDDNGGSFNGSSVAQGTDAKYLVYTGTWLPDEPIQGADIVNVDYDVGLGALISVGGGLVESFNVTAIYRSDSLLLESGDYLLLESGDRLTLE